MIISTRIGLKDEKAKLRPKENTVKTKILQRWAAREAHLDHFHNFVEKLKSL